MLLKELGQTGIQLPELGVGTWGYHGGIEPLRRAVEAGVALIDTAESYGTEPLVGQALRGIRDKVFLATKVSPQHFRRAEVLNSADASLRRLGIDRIDLYQLHEPSCTVAIEETMSAMEDLVNAGKVRFVGVSNFSTAQLERAQQALSRQRIVSNQVRYNLIDRTIEGGLLQYCQLHHITVIAYSPLARNGLGSIQENDPDGVIPEVCRQTGKTPAQVVINWALCKEPVVTIPKSSSVPHTLENCGASGWRLNAEQLRLLGEKVKFRNRSGLEILLRQCTPRGLKSAVKRLVDSLPSNMRSRIK